MPIEDVEAVHQEALVLVEECQKHLTAWALKALGDKACGDCRYNASSLPEIRTGDLIRCDRYNRNLLFEFGAYVYQGEPVKKCPGWAKGMQGGEP